VCIALVLQATVASAQSALESLPGEFGGYVAAEARTFVHAPRFAGQRARGLVAGVVAEPEWYLPWRGGDRAIAFVPFVRLDSHDSERTHFDIRELNYLHVGAGWDLRAGFAKVFWGVAESAHLVDVINQDDAVEDIDGEDKLGQPMLHLTVPREVGTFQLFVLPVFRERTFPGRRGRLRPAITIDSDAATYSSGAGRWHTDVALRWSRTFAAWDLGVAHFFGNGRDPRFRLQVQGEEPVRVEDIDRRLRLAPVYDVVHQTGVDLQHTGDSILWKLEVIGREGQGSYRVAAVAGLEYTFFAWLGTDADLGILGEFLYDSFSAPKLPSFATLPPQGVPADVLRSDPRLALRAPPSPFEHDVFVGGRLALNDVQSTTLLAGAIVDVEDGSRFWTVEAARRLGDRFRLSVDVRLFDGFARESFFSSTVKDDFVQVQLARYF